MFISQIALNRCSAEPASKTLPDPSDNGDEDAAGSLYAKQVPFRARSEVFLSKRRTMGKRMRYDVRSDDHCVQEKGVVYNVNQS